MKKIFQRFMRRYFKDVVVGAVIGVVIGCSAAVYMNREKEPKWTATAGTPVKIEVVETVEEVAPGVETIEKKTAVVYFDVPLDEDLQDYIFSLCEAYGVDPKVIVAMIDRESDFDSSCVGDGGNSLGLMQIQPRWHQGRMDALDCQNLMDPYQNVEVGIDYLAELNSHGKPIEWSLMAYNGGLKYANRKLSQGVVSEYAADILQKSRSF